MLDLLGSSSLKNAEERLLTFNQETEDLKSKLCSAKVESSAKSVEISAIKREMGEKIAKLTKKAAEKRCVKLSDVGVMTHEINPEHLRSNEEKQLKDKFNIFMRNEPELNVLLSCILVRLASYPVREDILDG